MKISAAISTAILLAASVNARNCKTGLDYCGSTLLRIGESNFPFGFPLKSLSCVDMVLPIRISPKQNR